MTTDQLFRWLFIAICVATLSISIYSRRRAHQSGSGIPRVQEGKAVLFSRLLLAAPLYLSIVAYMLNPAWMDWSAISLPAGLRWLGAAGGLTMLPLHYWVFRSIGDNVSETFLTKAKHVLVTRGPYRWMRHPLYSAAMITLVSLSLLAANWFMFAMACAAFLGIAGFVIPREEAELIRKFGDEYREYTKRTRRFAPRLDLFR